MKSSSYHGYRAVATVSVSILRCFLKVRRVEEATGISFPWRKLPVLRRRTIPGVKFHTPEDLHAANKSSDCYPIQWKSFKKWWIQIRGHQHRINNSKLRETIEKEKSSYRRKQIYWAASEEYLVQAIGASSMRESERKKGHGQSQSSFHNSIFVHCWKWRIGHRPVPFTVMIPFFLVGLVMRDGFDYSSPIWVIWLEF